MIPTDAPPSPAALAAALYAIGDASVGGIALRARAGPVRDLWLSQLRGLLGSQAPWRRMPLHIADGRLLGGLDLAATLRAGRPIAERGLMAEADGGTLVLAMAERVAAATAARLAAVLDTHDVVLERDGITDRQPARFGLIALDEGIDDERTHPALLDRMAFHVDLDGLDTIAPVADADAIAKARAMLPHVTCEDAMARILCETAVVLGIGSLRAEVLAQRCARLSAALAGRTSVIEADAAIAARLVLAPRATRLPAVDRDDADRPPPPPAQAEDGTAPPPEGVSEAGGIAQDTPGDRVVDAARAAIPPGLLLRLRAETPRRGGEAPAGTAGAPQSSPRRGRPAGVRRGDPRSARLNIIETLRAAAPWQALRASTRGNEHAGGRIDVRPEDFRVTRFKQRSETTTLFVVDASGSLALNRLAEAKGAVELLLKDCYIRRDQVALLAFRGRAADLLLPPTRSLVRAKRSLAGLPGGGATPLATAIDTALLLGDQWQRRGRTPVLVFLTDGRANVARDGTTGRGRAEEEALAAAGAARLSGLQTLVVDASPRPQAPARRLAEAMGALYLPLPHANAVALSAAVRDAAA